MSVVRVFHILPGQVLELEQVPAAPPAEGFYWIAYPRRILKQEVSQLQQYVQNITGLQLVDLHLTDLLNTHLPSHFDYTSDYDILVFRRLANHEEENASEIFPTIKPAPTTPSLPEIKLPHLPNLPFLTLRKRASQEAGEPEDDAGVSQVIETNSVGFALFDHLLVSVHPADCATRDAYIQRLMLLSQTVVQQNAALRAQGQSGQVAMAGGARLPASSADLMLRVVNAMVDSYLNLRRDLTRQLDHWQGQLLNPRLRFTDWSSLLLARNALHHLEEICEDQRGAITDWLTSLEDWPVPKGKQARREHDLLMVRSRDVLEHIERVMHHVRRMEQSAETAVQIHFNIQGNRTNDIMRALTAITAVFLPLHLIAGIFGMNFSVMPGLELPYGFWLALTGMLLIASVLMVYFVRHDYFLPNEADSAETNSNGGPAQKSAHKP